MFTGIVEEVGTIAAVEPLGNGVSITIHAQAVLDGLGLGDSIAVDGPCQTVTASTADGFSVQAIATTLGRSSGRPWRRRNRVWRTW